MIENVSKEQLKKAYDALKGSKEATMIADMDRKSSEQRLKEEFASAKQYFKKDGTTLDLAKVKMGTLKKAIEVKETGDNKLEQELELQEEYLTDMKNGTIPKGIVDSYVGKLRLVKEQKDNEKDVKENLKTTIDSDIVEALAILAGGEIEQEKERLEGDDAKPKKDKSELLALVKAIKAKMGV